VVTYQQVTNAILLLGHKPDLDGNIQEGVRLRADLAVRLYQQGVAPVIIPSGWYWPKDERYRRFREAWVIRKYLYDTYGQENITVVCEEYSTSIPENLLFTRELFTNLRQLTIVSGELFMERTRFLAELTFGDRIRLAYVPCQDGIGTVEDQQRVLENARCIFKDVTTDTLGEFCGLSRLADGTLKSRFSEISKYHRENCPTHRGR